MGTLLLRFVAPMQSWGVQSNFTHRDTGLEPSKSGVIGLLCAALGKPRDETDPDNIGKPTLTQLAQLKMGARVDREGLLKVDYHTAQHVMKAGGQPFKGLKNTELSQRYYLADAAFLVGLEGDTDLLNKLQHALHSPHWLLFLGRKAFVPSEPLWLENGLRTGENEQDLYTALTLYPRLRPKQNEYDDGQMRLVIEDNKGEITRRDVPLCFVKGQRDFTTRRMHSDYCPDRPLMSKSAVSMKEES